MKKTRRAGTKYRAEDTLVIGFICPLCIQTELLELKYKSSGRMEVKRARGRRRGSGREVTASN